MAADVLRLHNAERSAVGVAPLAWDPALAVAADQWASQMAARDQWGHSPRALRQGQGENLWMGTVGAYPLSAMIGAWIEEKSLFRPGIFPNVSRSGNWADVGHYTQMISSRSTAVGCAMRSNRRWTYFVCRYAPSGNVDGRVFP